jgi:hypothetical protein
MVVHKEKNAQEKLGEQHEQYDNQWRSWEDLCRKKLSYAEYELWQQNRSNPEVRQNIPRSVLRFFAMFEDTNVSDPATRRICFDWYIFIGCVCAGLTPLRSDRVYVVDLS